MKRVLVSILLLVYFTVSSGFVVNLHYCMGDFAGMEIGHPDDKECGNCGMPVQKKSGCCQDDVKVLKVAQDQSAATFAVFSFGVAKGISAPPFVTLQPPVAMSLFQSAPAHGPPLLSATPLYVQHCVFRI